MTVYVVDPLIAVLSLTFIYLARQFCRFVSAGSFQSEDVGSNAFLHFFNMAVPCH